jgi:hypothetical protein
MILLIVVNYNIWHLDGLQGYDVYSTFHENQSASAKICMHAPTHTQNLAIYDISFANRATV